MRSLQELKQFVPKFYGSQSNEDKTETKIGLENLLNPAPNASYMDIKLGTSTITINTLKKGEQEIARRTAKDKQTTSEELGYTICGFC